MKYNKLSRRMFLRGVGGSSLAIPFLPSLVNAQDNFQNLPRFVAAISKNGQRYSEFFPQGNSEAEMTQFENRDDVYYRRLSGINGPISNVLGSHFDAFRDKITIMSGLDIPKGGDHNDTQPLTAGLGGKSEDNVPTTPYSIDAVLEESPVFYPSLPQFGALRLAPAPNSSTRSFSWTKVGGAPYRIPSISSDKALFKQLYGDDAGQSNLSFLDRSNGLVIDKVIEDHVRLANNTRLSSADKVKLEQYIDTLRDIQTRMQTNYSSCAPPPLVEDPSHDVALIYQNHIDLAVSALACSQTRIVVFYVDHFKSEPSQSGSDWHGISHNDDSNSISLSNRYESWVGERIADLMGKMDSVSEGENTLLDNSLLYWGNEIAHGIWHKGISMPVFTAGSAGGKLRTGYFVDYRKRPFTYYAGRGDFGGTGRFYNQFLTTAMTAMGLSPNDYQFDENATEGGFGDYSLPIYNAQELWGPYLSERRNPTLPFYYQG